MEQFNNIPLDFINFILVTAFSLLIGLEQRRHHNQEKIESLYGTDRTYTFIGILGFVLYLISPDRLFVFISGGMAIVVFLAIFYWKRIELRNQFGITSIIIVLITYSIAPLLYTKPLWMTILLVTTVLVFTELKPQFKALSKMFDQDEFITVAKFLLMAGIILPLLPKANISSALPVSPFNIWLAVVVISSISYLSYILQKFIFPKSGTIITGILGGMYSSTATTVVLARQSKANSVSSGQISAAILLATAMMFVRVFVIALIFNPELAKRILLPFTILTIITLLIALAIYKLSKNDGELVSDGITTNPLEFKTALLFAVLFVVFTAVTKYVLDIYGAKGLNILSVVVGVTDIDPFLLSLFTGKFAISVSMMLKAVLIAITSNNLLKTAYAVSLGHAKIRKTVIIGFSAIIISTVVIVLMV